MSLLSYKNILPASVALIGGIMFAISQPSDLLANTQAGYTPDPDRPKPQRTQGGGSRGCLNAEPISLQLLVPQERTSHTVSSHPTLSWYLSSVPSMPLVLSVVEEGVAQPILVKQLPVKNSGLMQFKLPQDVSGLQIGKEYRWTVSLVCNPNRPSQSVYANAWIERKAVSSDFGGNFGEKSAYDKTLAYIKAGIWYDAIASISESRSSGSDLTLASNLFKNLLQQVGLKEASELKLL